MSDFTKASLLLPTTATVATGLFAGASLYISHVQTTAALKVGTPFFFRFWKPMYSRASKMQASLASLSAASALGYACTNDSAEDGTRNLWIAAGVTMGSIIPYTMLGMMPTNKLLLGMARDAEVMIESDDGSGASRELGEAKAAPLLQKWCRLHDVRTALSLAGFALAAVALAKSK